MKNTYDLTINPNDLIPTVKKIKRLLAEETPDAAHSAVVLAMVTLELNDFIFMSDDLNQEPVGVLDLVNGVYRTLEKERKLCP